MERGVEGYRYRESGLDGVELRGGVRRAMSAHGPTVSIEDQDGLHRAIGRHLVRRPGALRGDQARFLRHELGLSRGALERLMGCREGSLERWEAGGTGPEAGAERLLRALYENEAGTKRGTMEVLEAAPRQGPGRSEGIRATRQGGVWRVEAAPAPAA